MLEDHEQKTSLAAAQQTFMGYTRRIWPEFIDGRHHREIARVFDAARKGELRRIIINLPPRSALAVDTEIPTPEGYKRMDEIAVGDFVYGPDGRQTRVLGVSPIHRMRPVWRAETDDGAFVRVDDEHLWTVRLCRKSGKFHTYDTEWLANRLCLRRPMLPPQNAVEREAKELLVPPYTLGIWLGDGHKNQAIITSHDDDSPHVRARIESEGVRTTEQSTPMTFGLLGIKVKLRELGVLGRKHIPTQYLMGSIAQRRALLHGLMDSDGCATRGGQSFFATSFPAIRDGFMELCYSLGIKASCSVSRAKFNGRDYGECYRIAFFDADAFHLPRKRDRARGYIKPTGRYLSFKRDGYSDTVCIKVEREDGLFLAGRGHIVTHNTKSEFASWLLPSNWLGHRPKDKIIQVSNTSELAEGFGRKVRDTMETPEYQEIFPGITIKSDSRAAGRWNTSKKGEYYAAGMDGALAGRGAHLLVIDDPHSEKEAKAAISNPGIYDGAFEWYQLARQRLQPGGVIIIVMTRWSKRDITGRVVSQAIENGSIDEWYKIDYPAILPSGNPLWPEFWPLEEILKTKRDIPPHRWMAQYQQNPTSEGEAIIKRSDWKPWPKDRLPVFSYILQSWDTAFTAKTTGDYSACTTWGIFFNPNQDGKQTPQVMLINSYRERLEFPELKRQALQQMRDYTPDLTVIERRGSGISLIQELQQAGIYVEEFNPARSADGPNDKVARANAVSDVWRSGNVWYNTDCPLNEVTIEECADLPKGDHDDLADTATQAIKTLRDRMLIGTQYDTDQLYEEDETSTRRYRGRIY